MVYNQILPFFFFSLFFELIYFPIVNSAVSWCGNIDYFTDSGTLHHHNIGSWQTLSLYHNHNIQSPSSLQCRRTSGGRYKTSSPQFSSGIVEQVKWERAWKSPHLRKVRCGGEREKWPHLTSASSLSCMGWFSCTLVFRLLYYLWGKKGTTQSLLLSIFSKNLINPPYIFFT